MLAYIASYARAPPKYRKAKIMNDTQDNMKSRRIQFDFAPEALKRLESLQERSKASTKAEVIRDALKLYDWFLEQFEPDYLLEVKDAEGNSLYKIPVKLLLKLLSS